ncbi:MAG: hypothetical protein FD150_2093 [Rhodobacteraceae bacterium]|nr:MAG: hypothetical protein FD150_2093 [Paracoccaceae bacterium]
MVKLTVRRLLSENASNSKSRCLSTNPANSSPSPQQTSIVWVPSKRNVIHLHTTWQKTLIGFQCFLPGIQEYFK